MRGLVLSRYLLNQRAVLAVVFAVVLIAGSYFARPLLPLPWRQPGSAELYLIGVFATLLLLVPAVYSLIKRGPGEETPRPLLVAHIVAGVLGALLITVHSSGNWGRPPALLVLLVYFLVLQGAWARSIGAAKLAQIMASRSGALLGSGVVDKDQLREILRQKRVLLSLLDPDADEAFFSPQRKHWLRHPALSFAYMRLAHREARMIGARGTVDNGLAAWRRIHIGAAALLVAGIAVHVVTVTFFAGYVADGGPITWWHLTAWGG